jgi:hypothetical protein
LVSVPGGHGLLGVVAVLLLAAAGAAAWVDGGSLENSAGVGRRTAATGAVDSWAARRWSNSVMTARRCWERFFFFLFDDPAGAICCLVQHRPIRFFTWWMEKTTGPSAMAR